MVEQSVWECGLTNQASSQIPDETSCPTCSRFFLQQSKTNEQKCTNCIQCCQTSNAFQGWVFFFSSVCHWIHPEGQMRQVRRTPFILFFFISVIKIVLVTSHTAPVFQLEKRYAWLKCLAAKASRFGHAVLWDLWVQSFRNIHSNHNGITPCWTQPLFCPLCALSVVHKDSINVST